MGVLGLTPFLQRTCPEVIKQLPDRLRALSGKTIVIDGTLITQRLHFAPVPSAHRHVLGWYRLLRELKDYGVRAICVFDGKERSKAKTGETERRKQAQRMALTRKSIEMDRLKRLQKLVDLYDNFSSLKNPERERATSLLRSFVWATPIPSQTISSLSCDLENLQFGPQVSVEPAREDPPRGSDRFAGPPDPRPRSLPEFGHFQPTAIPENADQAVSSASEAPRLSHTTSTMTSRSDSEPEAITSAIASLYLDFCHSIPKLSLLSSPAPPPTSDDDTNDADSDYVMTKSQYQLTLDEGKLWDELIGSSAANQNETTTTKSALAILARKSGLMSESYQRRTNPPSAQTYHECKEILQAMGVPCLEPTGPFEAEALAASLVINGLADYVASEDTDVLVYEAPLIRNLTNRQGPLIILSGTDIRTVLQLDRARYLDFALLLGTDFSQRIKKVGPTRALKFIREHGSIERVIEHETRYPPRIPVQTYLEQVESARLVFRTLPPIPDVKLLQMRESDEGDVAEVLQRYGLHRVAAYDWDYGSALNGNYFEDDPSAF